MILHILEAQAVGSHLLRLKFNDGTCKTVDVAPLLSGPIFEPLRDAAYFARVQVDPICKTVVWPNGADIAPEYIYFKAFKNEEGLQGKFKEWGYIV